MGALQLGGAARPTGSLGIVVARKPPPVAPPSIRDRVRAGLTVLTRDRWVPDVVKQYNPRSELGKFVRACAKHLPAPMAAELIERIRMTVIMESRLLATVFRVGGTVEDYGVVSTKVVTNAGVGFIVDAFQNIVELEIMKYHGIGTGSTAEAVGDTALVTELTTQLNPDSTRATGTTAEGASANIFQSVGTNTLDANGQVLREHGLFSQQATGGGVLLDRSVFAAITLDSGDSIQTTYELSLSAGG